MLIKELDYHKVLASERWGPSEAQVSFYSLESFYKLHAMSTSFPSKFVFVNFIELVP